MREYWSSCEGGLEGIESRLAGACPGPRGGFARQASERNDYIRVVIDKSSIEVGEAQKRLDIPDVPRAWPVLDDLYL
jgi:hypothetical protein